MIAPLDDYVAKYMNKADLDDYHPLYKALPTYKGKIWGFFDDGDMFALYYRKDIFERSEAEGGLSRPSSTATLGCRRPGTSTPQVAQFITDQMAPNVYGAGHFRKAGSPGNQFDFLQQFRANGGIFFDDDMKAQLASPAGIKTLEQHGRREQGLDPRQQRAGRGGALGGVAAGQGRDDLLLAADRPHGRELLAARQGDQLRPAVRDRRQGRLRRVPGGNPEQASGYDKALAADSANPEAAYLFMQWATSPGSLAGAGHAALRAARPLPALALQVARCTGRLLPNAKEYLVNLNNSAKVGLLDMIMPGWQDYALSIDRMCTAVWAGADPKAALGPRGGGVGRDHRAARRRRPRRRSTSSSCKLPGSSADHTVEKLGHGGAPDLSATGVACRTRRGSRPGRRRRRAGCSPPPRSPPAPAGRPPPATGFMVLAGGRC